jgi:hypothetical protein
MDAPMNDLSQTLSTVRRRITRYKSKSITEQDTKASLIDPVLRALSWDLEDLDEVKREYKQGRWKRPVDYALFLMREPRLFVEAKALGKNLGDARWAGQIMAYAMVAGVKWVILTDGDQYRIYNSHAPVPYEKKLFRAVRLSDPGSPATETLQLLSKDRMGEAEIDRYWNAYYVDSQVGAALRALFADEPVRPMVNLVKKETGLTYKEVKASLKRAAVEIEFPLEVEPVPQRTSATAKKKEKTGKTHYGVSLADLIGAGLIIPPLELERTYKGQRLTARVEAAGTVTCMGETFKSLSYAGGHARKTIIGAPPGKKYPQTAGWSFWRYRNEAGELEKIHELRLKYLAQTDS